MTRIIFFYPFHSFSFSWNLAVASSSKTNIGRKNFWRINGRINGRIFSPLIPEISLPAAALWPFKMFCFFRQPWLSIISSCHTRTIKIEIRWRTTWIRHTTHFCTLSNACPVCIGRDSRCQRGNVRGEVDFYALLC